MKNINKINRFVAIVLLVGIVATSKLAFAEGDASANVRDTGITSESLYLGASNQAQNGEFADTISSVVQDTFVQSLTSPIDHKSIDNAITVGRVIYVTSTGYNSEKGQTDDSPFIAADGTYVYDGMVAANFLKFGTKIKIQGFGDKIFTVHDRMNKRFSDRVDVWFPEHSQAVQWGRRTVAIKVLP